MELPGPDVFTVYFWGVLGNIAVEMAAALPLAAKDHGRFPSKYRNGVFLAVRGMFALIAGVVPVALDAQNMWAALWLGASAPLIFDRAARGLEPIERQDPSDAKP